jgi:(p)ppGpp synthase/HD superfamily hydrolase
MPFPVPMSCRHEIAVIAALLHDVLDDTTTTPEALSAAFGPTVTAMVVSVSKLSAVNQMLRRDKRKVIIARCCLWRLVTVG